MSKKETDYLKLPLPMDTNYLDEDIYRLRDSFNILDACAKQSSDDRQSLRENQQNIREDMENQGASLKDYTDQQGRELNAGLSNVQNALSRPIEAVGLAFDKDDAGQLLQSMLGLAHIEWNESFFCTPPGATPKGVSLVFASDGNLWQAIAPSGPGTEAGPQDPVTSTGYWRIYGSKNYTIGQEVWTGDYYTGNDGIKRKIYKKLVQFPTILTSGAVSTPHGIINVKDWLPGSLTALGVNNSTGTFIPFHRVAVSGTGVSGLDVYGTNTHVFISIPAAQSGLYASYSIIVSLVYTCTDR